MSFLQAFTSTEPFAPSTLTNFCCYVLSLGQPDLIKHSHTVYMHQITPYALCSAASGVALESTSFLLFALFLLYLPFIPRPFDFKPSVLCPILSL